MPECPPVASPSPAHTDAAAAATATAAAGAAPLLTPAAGVASSSSSVRGASTAPVRMQPDVLPGGGRGEAPEDEERMYGAVPRPVYDFYLSSVGWGLVALVLGGLVAVQVRCPVASGDV